MTTIDELVVVERGLNEDELLRLLLEYRDGEAAAETCERAFPATDASIVWEQLTIQTDEIESDGGPPAATSSSRGRDSD